MNNSDKTNLTKRSLIVSILAMVLCIAMLIGTTFAWFTDSALTSVNRIQAGKLKIDLLEWKLDANNGQGGFVSIKNSNDPIFNYDRWEPGYSEEHLFEIENIGDLALKFQLSFSVDGEVGLLAEVIDVYYKADADSLPDSFEAVTAENSGYQNVGTLKELINDPDGLARGILMPPQASVTENEIDTASNAEEKSYVTACIVLHMREGVGNQYQGQSVGDNFDLNLVATQYTQESDSFTDQYDKDAVYPVMSREELQERLNLGGLIPMGRDILVVPDVQGNDYVPQITVREGSSSTLDLNGKTLSFDQTVDQTGFDHSPALLGIESGATLTIDGNGTVTAEAGTSTTGGGTLHAVCIHVNGGSLTINGGKYYGAGTVLEIENNSNVTINGGFFDMTPTVKENEDPYGYLATALLMRLNYGVSIDTVHVEIKGGTFVNFNPADNYVKGANTNLVPASYKVISETQSNGDIWYTVVQE